jgi:hypothetical protein
MSWWDPDSRRVAGAANQAAISYTPNKGFQNQMATLESQPEALSCSPTLSVLGYQEEGEWVALALEMDLRGYGPTFQQATQELQQLVSTQFEFARFKRQPELIWKPAEPIYWRLFEDARRDRLHEFVLSAAPRDPSYEIGGLRLPAPPALAGANGFEHSEFPL